MSYDAKTHSKARLGIAGLVPAVPVMPTAAQISKATGMMHLRLMGDAYVRTGMPSIHPASYKTVVAAIQACPVETSWSGSPTPYYSITVEPASDGQGAILKAGETVIGRVAVFPDAELVSADQPLEEQYNDHDNPGNPGAPPPANDNGETSDPA